MNIYKSCDLFGILKRHLTSKFSFISRKAYLVLAPSHPPWRWLCWAEARALQCRLPSVSAEYGRRRRPAEPSSPQPRVPISRSQFLKFMPRILLISFWIMNALNTSILNFNQYKENNHISIDFFISLKTKIWKKIKY